MENNSAKLDCPKELADLVPLCIAREHGIFPLKRFENQIVFAVEKPLDEDQRAHLRFLFKCDILDVVHPRAAIQEAIDNQLDRWDENLIQEDICWICPGCWHLRDDGTLVMPASGWRSDGCRWSGAQEVPPDAPDLPFWKWLTSQSDHDRMVDDKELAELRERWERIHGPRA